MAVQNNIPVAVDYTSRDFASLKNDLIARVQARVNVLGKQWSASDPADFGVALVEAFAHVGDLTSYYIDRVANEAYLDTANQRQSILNIASSYGYIPAGYRQSSVVLTFSNTTANTVTVPAGTLVSVDIVTSSASSQSVAQLFFTVSDDVVVPPQVNGTAGVATGTATHGENVSSMTKNAADPGDINDVAGELLGYSSGYPNQSLTLEYNQVVDGSVSVMVRNGNTYSEWTKVTNLSDYDGTSPVYTLTTNGDNYVTVNFGDGVGGAIPTLGEPIKVTYVYGGGLVGNIEGGYPFTVISTPLTSGIPLSSLSGVTVSNSSAALGGEDPESNDSIRTNAPRALKALNRAVTLKDYADLSMYVAGVGKAAAYATSPNSISVYVGPQISDSSTDYYPGYDSTNTTITSSWYELEAEVSDFLVDKTQIGTSVTFLPPVYTPVVTTVSYTKSPQYSDDAIIAAIKYAIVFQHGYNYVNFDQVIYPEQLEASLATIPGIVSAKVVELYRFGSSAGRNTLKPTTGEIFVFADANLSVYPVAGLSDLVPSTGTLSPLFKTSTFQYTMSDVATNTITLTPTVAISGATITVNGSAVTSGSASASISTPSAATTTITVVVTSADITVENTYTIKVIR